MRALDRPQASSNLGCFRNLYENLGPLLGKLKPRAQSLNSTLQTPTFEQAVSILDGRLLQRLSMKLLWKLDCSLSTDRDCYVLSPILKAAQWKLECTP